MIAEVGEACLGEACQDSNVIVAGLSLTHPRCARSQVISVDARQVIDPDEDDANIILCTRLAPTPRAVAVVDSLIDVTAFERVEGVDLVVSGLLKAGFQVMTCGVVDATGPLLTDWSMTVAGGEVVIEGPEGPLLFEGHLDVGPAWAQVARTDGEVVVVAGSRLGLGRLDIAIAAGRVVCARVPMR
jgi:hypothetical protein